MNLYRVTLPDGETQDVIAGSLVKITPNGELMFQKDPNWSFIGAFAPGHWTTLRLVASELTGTEIDNLVTHGAWH